MTGPAWIVRTVAVLLIAGGAVSGAGDEPVRLLFAGSSSTYWNDLPDAVARLVSGRIDGYRGRAATAEIAGRSGDDIRVYLQPDFDRYQYGVRPGQTFLGKVAEEEFDLVVLMVVCRFILNEVSDGEIGHAEAVTLYCDAIRAAGGEPVFYEMGWGRGEPEAQGRRRILDLAVRNRIRHFAPCSSAWERVRAERPDLLLQHPSDAAHPGDLGHFLNLACFHAALTREDPAGRVPRILPVWPHWTREEREARREAIGRAFAEFEPNVYQAALPEWMRRNAAAGGTVRIDEGVARYLEGVAWDAWRSVETALAGARAAGEEAGAAELEDDR